MLLDSFLVSVGCVDFVFEIALCKNWEISVACFTVRIDLSKFEGIAEILELFFEVKSMEVMIGFELFLTRLVEWISLTFLC